MIDIEIGIEEWNSMDGDNMHRINYDLNEKSIVFDVGSYKGEFAEKIYQKYGSKLYCFEPIKTFCRIIESRNRDFQVYNFGLGGSTRSQEIYMMDNATSIFNYEKTEEYRTIKIRDIDEVITDLGIDQIDLMKINIEGAEYELLNRIIEKDIVSKISNIQIQFHLFVDNAIGEREKIQEKLQKTHKITYNYDFIWENWEIK
jgi:FkbM family methyltransferase